MQTDTACGPGLRAPNHAGGALNQLPGHVGLTVGPTIHTLNPSPPSHGSPRILAREVCSQFSGLQERNRK